MTRKVSELNSIYPTTNRTLTLLRELYCDWNWTISGGYIRYQLGDSPYLYEHRLVVEVLYGRNADKYHVHHKDHVGTNNDPANLDVLDPSTHAKIHLLGSRRSRNKNKVVRQCAYCGEKVEREPRKAKAHKVSFCNEECFKNYRLTVGLDGRRYTKPPQQEELARLLQSHSREEIASMFGCLKYTVSRWITRYGLAGIRKQLTG